MFDPSAARARLEKLWGLRAHFGMERGTNRVFLDEIVSDRLQLLAGMQVLRDELMFAIPPPGSDREAAAADMSLPTVVPTLAFTNCGDRVHHGELDRYLQVVGSRFATMSEIGQLKAEAFRPTGGGTDDGATLAHVTWAHALDEPIRKRVYGGNAKSYVLCGFDLTTHTGRLDDGDTVVFGRTQESPWREARSACGAIVGTLAQFDERNDVHRRIRSHLGQPNFEFLRDKGVRTKEGVDVTAVVAAAIVAIRGMRDTAQALTREMDERGIGHVTASVTVNRSSMPDTMIYLARATLFGGEIALQGFGTDAAKYLGELVTHRADRRLVLSYGDTASEAFPVERTPYSVRAS